MPTYVCSLAEGFGKRQIKRKQSQGLCPGFIAKRPVRLPSPSVQKLLSRKRSRPKRFLGGTRVSGADLDQGGDIRLPDGRKSNGTR